MEEPQEENINTPPHPPRRAPGTAPDTSLHLGELRRAWLAKKGGYQPTIIRLIDAEMEKETSDGC